MLGEACNKPEEQEEGKKTERRCFLRVNISTPMPELYTSCASTLDLITAMQMINFPLHVTHRDRVRVRVTYPLVLVGGDGRE